MKPTLFISVTALLFAGTAHAQTTLDDGATLLPTLLVTGGLTPVEQEKSGRAFTVITSEQLERSQTRYVVDALRQVPGVHVSRTGSFGGLTQVRLRGAEGNQTLVLIDGVEVATASGGEFDFGILQVGDIDRIEILRGPQSAFWGANAMAGVINIITKRGERGTVMADTIAEAGTDGTFLGGVSVRGGGEQFDAALSARFRRTDGFNIANGGTEKDGDRNLNLSGRFTIDLTEQLTLDGNGLFIDRRSEFDSGSPPVDSAADITESRDLAGGLGLTWESLDGAWTNSARISGNMTASSSRGAFDFNYEGDKLKTSLRSSYNFDTPAFLAANHTVTVGYEWEMERYRRVPPASLFFPPSFETRDRTSNSLVAEYRGEFLDQLFLNAAVRHDFNDRFQDFTTYSLASSWLVPNTNTRLHASVGTGVTAPSFVEMFGFALNFVGNPDLIPEESFGWDVGIEQTFLDGNLVVDLTYFNQNLVNEVRSAGTTLVNLEGTSERQGIELSAKAQLWDGFSATASYTYTDTKEPGGVREIRRPMHSASLNLAQTFWDDRAQVFGEVIYNGEMLDNTFPPPTFASTSVTLDEYIVVNVGGSFEISENFEAYGRIENLFDTDYEEIFGYNSQGRTAFLGIKARF